MFLKNLSSEHMRVVTKLNLFSKTGCYIFIKRSSFMSDFLFRLPYNTSIYRCEQVVNVVFVVCRFFAFIYQFMHPQFIISKLTLPMKIFLDVDEVESNLVRFTRVNIFCTLVTCDVKTHLSSKKDRCAAQI